MKVTKRETIHNSDIDIYITESPLSRLPGSIRLGFKVVRITCSQISQPSNLICTILLPVPKKTNIEALERMLNLWKDSE